MILRPLVNAGLIVETPDLRLCVDPWLSDTAHYNSWAAWPRVPDLIERVGPVDLIAVSHLHQDHACMWSLRELLRRNPAARIVIGNWERNHLHHVLRREGIPHSIAPEITYGDTEIRIFPSEEYRDDIDSVIGIRRGNQSIVVWGDTPAHPSLIARVKQWCPDVTLATLPYAGASNWPRCFLDFGSDEMGTAAQTKRRRGVERYLVLRQALAPKFAIPHASGHLLTGRLWYLNAIREGADAASVAQATGALLLPTDGTATFDLDTGQASAIRAKPYDPADVMREALKLSTRMFDYEREESPSNEQLLGAISLALRRAAHRSESVDDHWYCFALNNGKWAIVSSKKGALGFVIGREGAYLPARSEIYIDPRALYGALTGKYHWNNLAGGSHFSSRRVPDLYRREVDDWLNHFHV